MKNDLRNQGPPPLSSGEGVSRRQILGQFGMGLGAVALHDLLGSGQAKAATASLPRGTHFAPRAKRVVHLFQSGAPAQQDLFDYKPLLNQCNGEDLPESVRQGQRLTSMTASQASFPLAVSLFQFSQHGQSGAWPFWQSWGGQRRLGVAGHGALPIASFC